MSEAAAQGGDAWLLHVGGILAREQCKSAASFSAYSRSFGDSCRRHLTTFTLGKSSNIRRHPRLSICIYTRRLQGKVRSSLRPRPMTMKSTSCGTPRRPQTWCFMLMPNRPNGCPCPHPHLLPSRS
jgi:hypothetical protein